LKQFFLLLFLFFVLGFSAAQEIQDEETDWEQEVQDEEEGLEQEIQDEDWDDFFDNDYHDLVEEEQETTVIESMSRSRVTLHAGYNFFVGYSPGWSELPWDDTEKKCNYILGAKMESLISLDFQLAENLKVFNSFYFSIPPDSNNFLTLKEFYFDYDLNKIIFLRAGQYSIAWGISPFFPFTNLPARIPTELSAGDPYIVKIDVPIGVGGVQVLGMTRYGFMEDPLAPKFGEIALGIKYNLALQKVDIDVGGFYFARMPLRFFTSVKTTLGKTELYLEGLIAVDHDKLHEEDLAAADRERRDAPQVSGNIGFVRDFFAGNLTLGAEVFYNGEHISYWFRGKEDIRDAESIPLFEGWNSALSFIVRPGVLGMRIFCQALYAFDINSIQVVPGITINPHKQLTVTLSVPMALGSRENDSYYRHNADVQNRPFSVVFGVSISGNFRYRIYMDRSAE